MSKAESELQLFEPKEKILIEAPNITHRSYAIDRKVSTTKVIDWNPAPEL